MAALAPSEVYDRALDERRRLAARAGRNAARLAYTRLLIAVAAALVGWSVFASRALAWPWLLVPVASFVVAARVQDRILRSEARAERAVRFYERGKARLENRWAGGGTGGEANADPKHPYASDLDLFGPGSLFELLCTARTRTGEKTLAAWLLAPAPQGEVLERQQAVAELRDRLDLREDLAILGEDVRAGVDSEALVTWASLPEQTSGRGAAPLAALLALANVATLALALAGWSRWLPFVLATLASSAFALIHRQRVRKVLGSVDRPAEELRVLAESLARLERESFGSARLAALRASVDEEATPASRRIVRLAHLAEWNDSRDNKIFAPIAALLLLGTQLAFAMERWRAASGSSVRRWIAALGEIEALASLAAFAFEHPEDPFPEVVEQGRVFDAQGLGHPLLPVARCVRSDVRLGEDLRLLMVSGSNMSGKSTFLRSTGIAVVLALAGAPVRALRLRVSRLQVGACLRVHDSIQEGTSRFYAEILRLRSIVDLGGKDPPLLFLLDEILHGTNSHDRRIGADALIRGLVEAGAIGLVTTHDLALTRIADELAPRAANVHFEDRLEGERIVFDYKLKAGVVQKSNALELMRAIGLKI